MRCGWKNAPGSQQKKEYDYFTTTLSISPMKNAQKLNEIGGRLAEQYGVKYLFSDFKKKNGYKRSVELSEEYGIVPAGLLRLCVLAGGTKESRAKGNQ